MKKKWLAIIVVMVLTLGLSANISAANTEKTGMEEELYLFLKGNNYEYLVSRANFSYMKFVSEFRENIISQYLVNMLDAFAEYGSEPDEQMYMEALVNLIIISDIEHAGNIAEQKKLDNLKSLESYANDILDIGIQTLGVLPSYDNFEEKIRGAIDGINLLAKNTDHWIQAISNLETVLLNYEQYDMFLELIEKDAEGDLKNAASKLRKTMYTVMNIKLDAYREISGENFGDYTEYFLNDILFDAAKLSDLYNSDDAFRFIIDGSEALLGGVASWELGTSLGKLIGNVTVGGENLVKRVLEMEALYDISVILSNNILNREIDFLDYYWEEAVDSHAFEIAEYLKFLLACRKRGEYCLYSTVVNDANILSWLNYQQVENAEKWYENQTEILEIISSEIELVFERRSEEEGGNITISANTNAITEGDMYSVYSKVIADNLNEDGRTNFSCVDIDGDGKNELLIEGKDGIFYLYSMLDGVLSLLGTGINPYWSYGITEQGLQIICASGDMIQLHNIEAGKMVLFEEYIYDPAAQPGSDAYEHWMKGIAIRNSFTIIQMNIYDTEEGALASLKSVLGDTSVKNINTIEGTLDIVDVPSSNGDTLTSFYYTFYKDGTFTLDTHEEVLGNVILSDGPDHSYTGEYTIEDDVICIENNSLMRFPVKNVVPFQ